MAEKKTLEEFIREYVDKKISDGEVMGIGDFKKSTLPLPDTSESLRKSALGSAISKNPTYGLNAERLAEAGLTGGGYASYLSSVAERAKKSALSIPGQSAPTSAQSYESYLSKHVKDAEGLYQKELQAEEKERAAAKKEREKYDKLKITVADEIVSKTIISYKDAYTHAISRGLDKEDATAIAEKSSAAAKEKLKVSILENVILNKLGASETLVYALTHGLSEDEAITLASAAKSINQDIKNEEYSKSYLDYLREQEAIKKQEKENK